MSSQNIRREAVEQQLDPLVAQRLYAVRKAIGGTLNALRNQPGLGTEVVDDEDRAAYGPQFQSPVEVPTPMVPAASNVINFPVQPAIGEVATSIIAEADNPDNMSYLEDIRPDEFPTIEQRAA
jgi:hypothetical protein